jgi:hypothetical protein
MPCAPSGSNRNMKRGRRRKKETNKQRLFEKRIETCPAMSHQVKISAIEIIYCNGNILQTNMKNTDRIKKFYFINIKISLWSRKISFQPADTMV